MLMAAAVAVGLVGAFLQLWCPRIGTLVLGLGLLGLLVVVTLQQSRTAAQIATMHRAVKEFHRQDRALLESLGSAPVRPAQKAEGTAKTAPSESPSIPKKKPATAALSGRAAAPEVRNANTEMTLQRALDPAWHDRAGAVVGVFSPDLTSQLEERGFVVLGLRRGLAASAIADAEAATFVIDEAALVEGPWGGSLLSTGTRMMAELSEALTVALSRGLVCVVVPDPSAPIDVHSNELRRAGVARLPLDASADDSHGAPAVRGPIEVLDAAARARMGDPA